MSEFPIRSGVVHIGRNPDCEVHLDNSAVSRRHARILHDARGFSIEDLKSSNGTKVNGTLIKGKTRLYSGDVIQICGLEFVFESHRAEAQPPFEQLRGKKINSAYLDDTPPERPINVTSQIDMRSTPNPTVGSRDAASLIRSLTTKLEVMMHMMKNLGRIIDSRELLPQFLDNLLKLFPQADYSCILAPQASGQLELIDFKAHDEKVSDPFKISRSIPQTVFETHTAILSDDLRDDVRFNVTDSLVHSRICSIMAVPIIDQAGGEPLGVIQIDSRTSGRPFTATDLDLLVSIANQVAVYHENLRFHEIKRHEEIIEQEMAVAYQVQRGFLPSGKPILESYEFFDFYQPAKYIGGDYFDYIPLPDGRLAIVLADVSGKGISAALLMAKLSAEVRFSLMTAKALPEAMARLNRSYCDSQWGNRFITLALTVIDPVSDQLHLLNAGHLFPIRRGADGVIEEIGEGRQGFPIGIVPDAEYEEVTISLKPNETLFFMSDGITDAMNSLGEYFELARVYRVLQTRKRNTATVMGALLIDEVRQFVGATAQSDDQCLVVVGKVGETPSAPK